MLSARHHVMGQHKENMDESAWMTLHLLINSAHNNSSASLQAITAIIKHT